MKKKPNRLIFAGIAVCIILFSSCEKVIFPVPEIILPDTVSYSIDIQPIWDDRCVSCHPPTRGLDLRPGVSYGALISGGYVDTANAAQSELVEKLNDPHPSNDPTSLTERQLVLEWIQEGAKNN